MEGIKKLIIRHLLLVSFYPMFSVGVHATVVEGGGLVGIDLGVGEPRDHLDLLE